MISPKVICEDPGSVCRKLASDMVSLVANTEGECHIALSGGETPLQLFRGYATNGLAQIDWTRLHLWWVDERALPPQDDRSNYGVALRSWLLPAGAPMDRVHRMVGEIGAKHGAMGYQVALDHHMPSKVFDLVLLGIGGDGHVASLFPGVVAAWSGKRVEACIHPTDGTHRISLCKQELLNSRRAWFLVVGERKQKILAQILKPGCELPAAQIAQQHSSVNWYLDAGAAAGIPLESE